VGGKPHATLSGGLVRALADIAILLERHPGQAAVIGGIAVIARGVRRLTRDVDLVFEGHALAIPGLMEELASVGIVPRIPDASEFAQESQVLLMRHAESGIDVDVSRSWLPFELEAIAASPTEVLAGVRLPIVRAEDLIIFKSIAWRPQDRQDVERLLALHADDIDLDRVRKRVAELAEALEVDRLSQLEAVICEVLGRRG
jgi:hypothetical protein